MQLECVCRGFRCPLVPRPKAAPHVAMRPKRHRRNQGRLELVGHGFILVLHTGSGDRAKASQLSPPIGTRVCRERENTRAPLPSVRRGERAERYATFNLLPAASLRSAR